MAKILVIEDDRNFSAMICALLSEEGYKAQPAYCGKDGVKMSLSFAPDLILLDFHLGDMTGYDVGTAIRYTRATAHIPFILLSSLGGDPMLMQTFATLPNCKGNLTKNQPVSDILNAVRKLLPADINPGS